MIVARRPVGLVRVAAEAGGLVADAGLVARVERRAHDAVTSLAQALGRAAVASDVVAVVAVLACLGHAVATNRDLAGEGADDLNRCGVRGRGAVAELAAGVA